MWMNPIYGRDPVDQRHGHWQPTFYRVEPRRKPVPSTLEIIVKLSEPCWTGWCNKCGRPLISAVTRVHTPPDKFECGICE